MTKGQYYLKTAMQTAGYKTVVQYSGLSQSALYEFLNGRKDPQSMKLTTAKKLFDAYGIEYEDWFIEK